MEKLLMCRICLVDNVRMFAITDKSLQEIYKKLTDVPFVTEDSRPMLACFFCYAKLKQCYQLQRKSLEAEDLFAQMLNNDELNPLTNRGHSEFVGGFVKTSIETISIVDDGQSDSETIEIVSHSCHIVSEKPVVSEKQCDVVVEIKVERESDEIELEHLDNSCLDVADIPPHQPESDSEDDVPLMEFKTKVVEVNEEAGQEIFKKKQRENTKKLELGHLDNSCLDVADIPPHQPESDSEEVPLMGFQTKVVKVNEEAEEQEVVKKQQRAKVMKKIELELDNGCLDVTYIPPQQSDSEEEVPLMGFKTKVLEVNEEAEGQEEVSKEKQKAKNTKRVTAAKKPKLDTRRTKLEDATTVEQTKIEKFDSKVIRTTQKRTSRPGTYLNEPYKCDQSSFYRVKKEIQHIRTNIGKKPYYCDVCRRSFSQKCDLTKHNRIHTGEKPYKCDVCQRSFSQKSNLRNHIRIHTGVKPFKCELCERSFRQLWHLKRHILIHTGEKSYKCDVCQRSFSDIGGLMKHIRRLIHTGEKSYECDVCVRTFSNKSHFAEHVRIHNGEKPYKYDEFHRTFSQKSTNTREKPHKCGVCQRCFTQKGDLTKHIRIHTGEKPYKCDVCQRSFSEKGNLTTHILFHIGKNPYKCDVCPRSFSSKGNLANHIRIHTGEKPYKCDVCQRSFTIKGNLIKHIRKH